MGKISLSSYWKEIISIIEGGLKPDPHKVSSFAEHMALRLENEGETKLAGRIIRLIDGASKPAGSTYASQSVPSDIEAQQALIEQIVPSDHHPYPILPEPTQLEIERFVILNKRSGELESSGIKPPTTLLLFGPPGCGKTMAAYAIASDLDLPLVVVRLDSLLGSFLGNSAKNLRRVFDTAISRPCVLLLDEFDAIGKMRDDSQEVGEIKRLVNSLLQNLDRLNGDQIVIAATNHHHILDSAVWRRFDVTLHLDKPSKVEIERIINENILDNSLSKVQLDGISTIACGLSGSEITMVIQRANQDKFLLPEEPLNKLILRGVLATQKGIKDARYYSATVKDLILATYDFSQGEMSIRQIARVVGCSAPYALEVLGKMEGETNDQKRQSHRNTVEV